MNVWKGGSLICREAIRIAIFELRLVGYHGKLAAPALTAALSARRATVVAGSAGQEYVDNVFYNRENDYELATLNRSEWDVWKTPINAKYNYWAYNETAAVSGEDQRPPRSRGAAGGRLHSLSHEQQKVPK